MKGFLSIFSQSAKEFSKVRTLTITAIFIALYVVLEGFFSINFFGYLKINFSFIAIAIIGMLFGPCVSIPAAVICDVLGYLMKPEGGFLIVFSIVPMTAALIYGSFLYNNTSGKTFFKRIVLARFLETIICNLILNTSLLMYYGFIPANILNNAMMVRIVKNAIELPIYTIMLAVLLPAVVSVYKKVFTVRT